MKKILKEERQENGRRKKRKSLVICWRKIHAYGSSFGLFVLIMSSLTRIASIFVSCGDEYT